MPWIGIHSKNYESSPQKGIYLAIILNLNDQSFNLVLIHGTDYSGIKSIKEKTLLLRKLVIQKPNRFDEVISLALRDNNGKAYEKPSQNRPQKYEKATIYGIKHIAESINDFQNDLEDYLKVYADLMDYLTRNDEEYYQNKIIRVDHIADNGPTESKSNIEKITDGTMIRKRSLEQKSKAIKRAEGKCEFNENHKSFKTLEQFNFLEAHHLIPMEVYDSFKRDIDHFENIFCLCPNCHRMIHLAERNAKKEIITALFEKRKGKLTEYYGIDLSILMRLYEID